MLQSVIEPLRTGAPAARVWHALRLAYLMGAWVAAVYVAGTTIRTTIRTVTPAVYWDDWQWMTLLHEWVTEKFTWSSLFEVQNEHRIAFRRVLQFADYYFTHSTNWPLIAFNVVEYATTATALIFLLRLAADRTRIDATGLGCYAAFVLILVFCAPNLENLTWGAEAGYIPGFVGMVLGGLTMTLSIAASHRGQARAATAWLSLTIVIAFAATFSATGAILMWPLMLAIAYWGGAPKRHQIVLAIVGTSTILFFFSDFHLNSNMNADPGKTWKNLATYDEYLPHVIGNIIVDAQNFNRISFALGWLGLTGAAAAGIVFLRKRESWSPAQLSLLAIIAFAVGGALMISLSRQNWGGSLSMVLDRYRILTATFWAAIAALLLTVRWSAPAIEKVIDLAFGLLSLFIIVQIVEHQRNTLGRYVTRYEHIELANDALRVGVMDKDAIAVLGLPFNFDILIKFFRERRLSVFADGRFAWIGQPLSKQFRLASDSQCHGAIGKLDLVKDEHGVWRATGWAWDDSHGHALDHLLFVNQAGERIVGLASGGLDRPDLKTTIGPKAGASAGWQGYFRDDAGTTIFLYGVRDDAASVCMITDLHLP